MTEQEIKMLEMAAKAAGHIYRRFGDVLQIKKDDSWWDFWNPKDSWDDAGDLAADLTLKIAFNKFSIFVFSHQLHDEFIENYSDHNNDRLKAACYAITRAAQAIGERL